MDPASNPCPYCGEQMPKRRRSQCGKPDCKRAFNRDRMRKYLRDYKAKHGRSYRFNFTYRHDCPTCGATFENAEPNAQYCSLSCANTARSYERSCEHCGKTWQAGRADARWCSAECRRITGTCTELVPYTRPTPTLSPVLPPLRRRWYAGACRRCETTFVSDQPENRYCSPACRVADTRNRTRARKKQAYVAHVYRVRIFERDRWTCRLCGRKVRRNAVVPHPLAPVIDHIVPLARGGTHEPANVQCAHFLCNSIKSDRGGGEQLMLIG